MTREHIKQAALLLFVKDGYEGARLADIAKAVNIKTPSIYFHFDNKEALFTELFDDMKNKKLANITGLRKKLREFSTAKEKLFCLYNDFALRGYEDPEEMFWKRSALFPPSFLREQVNHDLIIYQEKFVEELLKPVLLEGIATNELMEMDVNQGVVVFLSMIQGMFSEFHYSKPEIYREKINLLWDYYWNSIERQSIK